MLSETNLEVTELHRDFVLFCLLFLFFSFSVHPFLPFPLPVLSLSAFHIEQPGALFLHHCGSCTENTRDPLVPSPSAVALPTGLFPDLARSLPCVLAILAFSFRPSLALTLGVTNRVNIFPLSIFFAVLGPRHFPSGRLCDEFARHSPEFQTGPWGMCRTCLR